IIGVSTALFLARRRVSVVLCEKGSIAAEQSSRNWGWVREMGRDPRELPLIIESLALWGDMNELVAGETGFRRTGTLYLCRVAAAVTERGRIACDAVVLAGGAWSRLFCGSLGLTLPQLHVLASVMRTEPVPGGPDLCASAPGFAFRRRLDGGYTVANNTVHVADIVPDSFRFFFDFLPVLRLERKALRLRLGRRFLDQLMTPSRWALDRPSP